MDMMAHYEALLEQQNKIYTDDNENYFIDDETCQECGIHFNKLLALQCGNGYFSWRCATCWNVYWKRLKNAKME